ncbi:hypothetical protein [Actinopolymorpha alba]|uniref:hypothetical protein n=1 Tax=Actinopolymorpha alba TaxID=533267 RepID=UPI000361BFDB|nr:hypothetical protein [Actinopolymorpha alba]
MARGILLALHIACGAAGLLLIPVIALREKGTRAHVLTGRAFVYALRGVALTAVGLVLLEPRRLWPFLLVAVFSVGLGETGRLAIRGRIGGGTTRHVGMMGGACIAFVTAVTAVNVPSPFAWIGVVVIGSVLVRVAVRRAAVRRVAVPSSAGPRPADEP